MSNRTEINKNEHYKVFYYRCIWDFEKGLNDMLKKGYKFFTLSGSNHHGYTAVFKKRKGIIQWLNTYRRKKNEHSDNRR